MSDRRYLYCEAKVGVNTDATPDELRAAVRRVRGDYELKDVRRVGDALIVHAAYRAIGSNAHQIRRFAAALVEATGRRCPVDDVVLQADTTVIRDLARETV